jgi:hypothetical protein
MPVGKSLHHGTTPGFIGCKQLYFFQALSRKTERKTTRQKDYNIQLHRDLILVVKQQI